MRAIWKGHIRFSLVTIPIRIYSAIDSAQSIKMNQLHKDCNGPVGYDKKCKKCSTVLSTKEIVKGYQYEPDQYVVIEPDDLQKLKLKSTKVIEIEGFIDASEIHPTLYDSPYFVGPDGEVAAQAYALLRETLRKSGKLGVGKVVLRDRENVMMLSPQENGLMMYKLRYPDELRSINDIPQLNGTEVDESQLNLANTLVESMTTTFDKIKLKDQYSNALKELIQSKIEGKEVITVVEEEKPVVDIMTALKASIEQSKSEKKPMKKATGKTKTKAKAKTTQTKKRKTA